MMKFKDITFEDMNAKRVYSNYISRIRKAIKSIKENERDEILMEFNSHIYESLSKNNNKPELESLLNIIDRLGDPEEVLKPLIADEMLKKATKTFNPIHLFKALALNLTNGISYSIFAILYLFLGSFLFLIIAKLFNPNVGLFFKGDNFQAIGLMKDSTGYEELLGNWFIPFIVCSFVLFYCILTLFLRLKVILNRKIIQL